MNMAPSWLTSTWKGIMVALFVAFAAFDGGFHSANGSLDYAASTNNISSPTNSSNIITSVISRNSGGDEDRSARRGNGGFDYKDALSKSILFFEAQRSGKLPPNTRLSWRGDSGLEDGKLAQVDLVGGYYDAGDNVKFGLPMAFTVTTLAWSAIYYGSQLQQAGELHNVQDAIKWGTDYFLKASAKPNKLYVQVGDPLKDHQCWIRPENMQTPRTVYVIDETQPGTEIAAETAAALASASIVFRHVNIDYSQTLLHKAKEVFNFAKTYQGTYDGECPFYCSVSGYNDELQWAATWLYLATQDSAYIDYINEETKDANVAEFSWDLKYVGSQILLTHLYLQGNKQLDDYKTMADSFICSVLPQSPYNQITITPGGLLYYRDGANTQYVTGAAFLFTVYADILSQDGGGQKVTCGKQQFSSSDLLAFAKQQMDYLLGQNPQKRSYMVGFGNNPPTQPHHRGASVPVLPPGTKVDCGESFAKWFSSPSPNPHVLTGAIVGGPDKNDKFEDKRANGPQSEPTTYINSLAVGALARLTQ